MSTSPKPSLVGSIVERKSGTHSVPAVRSSGKTGFPTVQHRSKSAFSRARTDQRSLSRPQQPPSVKSTVVQRADSIEDEATKSEIIAQASDDWRRQMEQENERRVETMSPEELEAARREILEQFGPNIGQILKQSRAAREAAQDSEDPLRVSSKPVRPRIDSKVLKSAMASRAASPDPFSPTSTRPSSRLDRQIRFAQLTPKDVHVYESAPPSPPKKALALPAPSGADGPTVSLGQWKGRIFDRGQDGTNAPDVPPIMSGSSSAAEEGTPEDIRRRFFPTHAPHDPALAWIEGPVSNEGYSPTLSAVRFDLSGAPIPSNLSAILPTHLGLHHHAEGKHAGYTLEDIFHLSRSTVPAQRASMLGILASIALQVSRRTIEQLIGQEASLRKRILAVGIEALHEKGSVGVRAVEVTWSCVVAWDPETASIEGIELKHDSDDTLTTLPLDYILKQTSDAFDTASFPPESILQLLEIVHRLAKDSNDAASTVADIPQLLPNLLRRFLFISASDESGHLPNPLAISVLVILAQASRKIASKVADSAPALLRFLVMLPDASPYPPQLAISLLISTLELYRVLASYGLCSQLATTASEHLRTLMHYVLSDTCTSEPLREAWLGLLEAWMTCAVDPHRTSPDHDILWSQITGWEWGSDIYNLRHKIPAESHRIWTALWRAEAAWLEGSTVNAIKGGESEKAAAIAQVGADFEEGVQGKVVEDAAEGLAKLLTSITPNDILRSQTWSKLSQLSDLLASTIRLWLSCLPPHTLSPIESPPFRLPFAKISAVCAQLTSHPLWMSARSSSVPRIAQVASRSLSLLLISYLHLSQVSLGVPPALWMAQAFSILGRLNPGDEEQAKLILSNMAGLVTPDLAQSFGWQVEASIWDKHGLEPILPFLTYSVQRAAIRVGPLWMSPRSISESEAQRLPHIAPEMRKQYSLPLARDWVVSPLDHLLRSGESEAWKSLPASWDYSEVEVTRATLLLAKLHRHVLLSYHLRTFILTREETIFSCMKVFMLEHEQQQETSVQEVFRDNVVNELMENLLAPFTISAVNAPSSGTQDDNRPTLEEVAKGFLGEGTPFYQYYTDFVGLYDSVSFSHPLFARLLLPPLSMRYPPDFRKYLWADYSHVIRTIRPPIESLIAPGLGEYLWPVETDAEVLGAYLRSLVQGQTDGLMRFLAVHHIACNVWPDLGQDGEKEERAVKLLQAVVGQTTFDVVKQVVYYHQTRDQPIFVPECFEERLELRSGRRSFAKRCGESVWERSEKLFE